MLYQDELLESQVVSIWVGDLNSIDDVTEYLGQPFERDFGFLLDRDDLPRYTILPMEGPDVSLGNPPLERVDVRQLIEVFSWSGDWADEAEQACRRQGIDAAKLVVVFLSLRYRPDLVRNPKAPIRFIGTFPWPSGQDDWLARLEEQVVCPPFPVLRCLSFANDELFAWSGRVHLEAWKNFATREELADEFMTFRFSPKPSGDLTVEVNSVDNRPSHFKPTEAQVRAFQHLLDNQQIFRETVLSGIFSVYDHWRQKYTAAGLPAERMPEVGSLADLARLIAPSTVHVLETEKDGFSQIGFSFRCRWDEEHGLGVLTHKGCVVDVGESETAFTGTY